MKNKTRLLLLITLTPLLSLAQETQKLSDNKMQQHAQKEAGMQFDQNERLDDPYLPNAYNNEKVTPAYKYSNKKKAKSINTIITTVQVNVNSSGQNIVGDAANEPNITWNPLDKSKMAIGWRQFDNVSSNFRQAGWGYTTDSGQTWTFPGKIDPGVFHSDPVLDYDSAGNFYYNSLYTTYATTVYESTNGGVSWGAGTPAGGGDKQWMAIDRTPGVGSGNIYSFWSQSFTTCGPGFFTRSTNGNSSYEPCTIINGNPSLGTMTIGNAGQLYIVGQNSTNDGVVVCKSLNAQIPNSTIVWENPVSVYLDGAIMFYPNVNPAGILGQGNIDLDRSNGPGRGNVYVLASVQRLSINDPGDVMFSRSTDSGMTWTAPIRINDDASTINTQWIGTMSVSPTGRIDIVWLDTRDGQPGSDSSALYYSYSYDQGNTWSANERLSPLFYPHIGYPNQNKMGDYFDMISDSTGAHLAWANTLNGEEDVYYSHIIPPTITTAVNQISRTTIFSIYPNPSNGVFDISSNATRSEITIYNSLGENVYSIFSTKGTSKIDISNQPAGVYFLKMADQDGNLMVKKIIKE